MSIEALRLRFARGELCLLQTAVASPIRDLAELLARRHPALPRDW